MANQPVPFSIPPRNPVTHAKHRKEVFWMITFPIIIGGLLFAVAVVALLIMTINEGQVEQARLLPDNTTYLGDYTSEEIGMIEYLRSMTNRLASVSEIWLILLVMVFSLIALAVLAGFVYLFTRLLRVLPGYMRVAQDFMLLTSLRVRRAMDSLVEPFLRGKSAAAASRQARVAAMRQASDILGKITGKDTE